MFRLLQQSWVVILLQHTSLRSYSGILSSCDALGLCWSHLQFGQSYVAMSILEAGRMIALNPFLVPDIYNYLKFMQKLGAKDGLGD